METVWLSLPRSYNPLITMCDMVTIQDGVKNDHMFRLRDLSLNLIDKSPFMVDKNMHGHSL
jgi:hypothetical protein